MRRKVSVSVAVVVELADERIKEDGESYAKVANDSAPPTLI